MLRCRKEGQPLAEQEEPRVRAAAVCHPALAPFLLKAPSRYQRTPEASRLAAPQAGCGQEVGIFCELQAWSLLTPISVSACLELQGQQASVILVARGSGLETLPMWDESQSPRGGTLSLKGEEMGFQRSSMGP